MVYPSRPRMYLEQGEAVEEAAEEVSYTFMSRD